MTKPSIYTPEFADEICRRLALGESLNSICKTEGFPAESTVRLWVMDDREGFSQPYFTARALQMEVWADQIVDIADDSGFDATIRDGKAVCDGEAINRARLRIDTRKWLMSHIAPKKYGDKLQNTHSGPDGKPIQIEEVNAISLIESRLDRLIARRPAPGDPPGPEQQPGE